MTKKNKILVIVAHPDDETIGCGGVLAQHSKNRDDIFCMSLTNGVGARFEKNYNKKELLIRKKASFNAQKILGFKWLKEFCRDFPDNSLDSLPIIKIIKVIEEAKKIVKPDIIYTHNLSDLNIDHRIVGEAVLVAFRPQPKEVWKEIRLFEVPSTSDYFDNVFSKKFSPNLFINIKQTWKKKLSALKAYSKEMRKYPHSRSLKGIKILAQYRGVQNGLEFAEAFDVIKKIIR